MDMRAYAVFSTPNGIDLHLVHVEDGTVAILGATPTLADVLAAATKHDAAYR